MLVDNITIKIKAGNGGNGVVHFKRNAQTAKGGPDGGNGGNGGNVYVQGINDIEALRQYRFTKKISAENGINGGGQNKYGRNGEDTIIKVPVGTRITETETGKQYEIENETDKILLAKGGIGGRGNNEFKTATDQAPYYAEKGTPGEEKELFLQLRIIADIGLIGLPNAGKSSLLTALTNARPKIGNYPFTTLEPNLGVMNSSSAGVDLQSIPTEAGAMAPALLRNGTDSNTRFSSIDGKTQTSVENRYERGYPPSLKLWRARKTSSGKDDREQIILADIPGLIEGASKGKGLGTKFLQHIEKTKVLAHCIAADTEDVLKTYTVVRNELGTYSKTLLEKPEVIILTKIDLVDEKILNEKMKALKKKNKQIFHVSIYDEESLENLKHNLIKKIKNI